MNPVILEAYDQVIYITVADPGGVHRVQVNPPLPDIACVLFEFNTMLFTFKICLGMLLKLAKAS